MSHKKPTTNKVRPGVKITLDKERTLFLDLNAMIAFEEAAGKRFQDASLQKGKMSPRDLRAMLWACLIHEDDALTEKQVGSWITAGNMVEITSKLNEAFEASMPKSEGKQTVPLARRPQRG